MIRVAYRSLTIGIDARAMSHPQPGGFKTYVKNLIRGLSQVDDHNQYWLYADRRTPGAPLAPSDRFKVGVVGGWVPLVGPILREQVLLPSTTWLHRADVAHFPAGTAPLVCPCKTVVTIHDAIEHLSVDCTGAPSVPRGSKRWLMALYNRFCQRLVARSATLVITVSDCSRDDIIRYVGVPESKIKVIPEAPGPEFGPIAPAHLNRDLSELGPFVMAIGSADPRKNIANLVRAYAALSSELIERHRLVLVWSHDHLRQGLLELARQEGVLERIVSVAAPDDSRLGQLYNAATVFVFPSLYEGFGLPPLEAMACGAPVISSNTSSLPEVLGDSAVLVNPRSVGELTRALDVMLSDSRLRSDLSARGLARVRRFSWERTAQLTLNAYEKVAAGRAMAEQPEWRPR